MEPLPGRPGPEPALYATTRADREDTTVQTLTRAQRLRVPRARNENLH